VGVLFQKHLCCPEEGAMVASLSVVVQKQLYMVLGAVWAPPVYSIFRVGGGTINLMEGRATLLNP
jgi:hypothetical protein